MQTPCSQQEQDDWREILRPLRTDERPTLVEFLDEHYTLPPHKALNGPEWKTRAYQKGLLLLMAHPGIRELYIAKCTQFGLSEGALGLMMWLTIFKGETWGYFMPTDKMAKRLNQSVKHWVSEVDIVREQFLYRDKPSTKGPGNSNEEKWFTKANQYYLGGNTVANTSSITLAGAILDEFTRVTQDIKSEGSLLGAARGRQKGSKRGDVLRAFSTHTSSDSLLVKQMSLCGDDLFECEVPCPKCDHYSTLSWGGKDEDHGIKWDEGDTSTIRHVCSVCGQSSKQKEFQEVEDRCRWITRSGYWIDISDGNIKRQKEGCDPWIYGDPNPDEWVRCPAPEKAAAQLCADGMGLYGVTSWADEAQVCVDGSFLEKNYGDSDDIKRFENEYRGIPFEREIETAVTVDEFLERREEYSHKIPKEVQALTIGIDFGSESGGYSYYQIDGHGAKGARWAIEKRKIAGDCQDFGSRMYTTLDQIMKDEHEREDGVMLPISLAIMDGRHVRDMVMRLAALDPARRIVVFGSSNYKAPLFDFVKKRDWDDEYGCYALSINPHVASEKTYYKLGIEKGEDGYYRFPIDEEFNRAYAKELGADKPYQKATPHGWVTAYKKDHSGVDNEGHDVAKYNTIAIIAGIEHGIITINNNEVMERIEIPHPAQTQQPALDISKGYDAFGNMFR